MSNPKQPVSPNIKDSEIEFDINESAYKTSHTAVRKARRFAMQGLYEWLMTDRRFEQTGQREWKSNAPHDIAARTRANNAMHTVHLGYYHELMRHIPDQVEALDALIEQHLDREINLLDPVEHAILLIGVYELKDRFEIPYKVVLDEAMKLNTHFGATDAHKLINAVLDKLAPKLRELEVTADANLPKVAKQTKPVSEYDESLTDETTSASTNKVGSNSTNTTTFTSNSDETLTEAKPKRDSKPRIGLKSSPSATRKRVPPSTSVETNNSQIAQSTTAATTESNSESPKQDEKLPEVSNTKDTDVTTETAIITASELEPTKPDNE